MLFFSCSYSLQSTPLAQRYFSSDLRHKYVITGCSLEAAESIYGDRLCLWEPLIFNPHKFDLPWPIVKTFVTGDYVGDSYPETKFGANKRTGEGFWAWNITILFIYILFYGQPIFVLDGSNDANSYKLQGCALWGFVYIAVHLRGQPQPCVHFSKIAVITYRMTKYDKICPHKTSNITANTVIGDRPKTAQIIKRQY